MRQKSWVFFHPFNVTTTTTDMRTISVSYFLCCITHTPFEFRNNESGALLKAATSNKAIVNHQHVVRTNFICAIYLKRKWCQNFIEVNIFAFWNLMISFSIISRKLLDIFVRQKLVRFFFGVKLQKACFLHTTKLHMIDITCVCVLHVIGDSTGKHRQISNNSFMFMFNEEKDNENG